jgi:signal transduction histidine kinase
LILSRYTERRLVQEREKIIEANKKLTDFAHTVSHDLKGPLQRIKSLVDLINTDPQNQSVYLDKIKSGVTDMARFINDLLNYSESGSGKVKKTTTRLDELMNKIIEVVPGSSRYSFDYPGSLQILTEETLLYQVLLNLVSNAVKYHHKDKGNISVRVQKEGEYYIFRVKDDGPGIPQQDRERIFQPFQRSGETVNIEGLGIGLSTVKRIIEEKGGKIWLNSKIGEGSEFSFHWYP